MMRILIGIPTFKRPVGLLKLLESLLALEIPEQTAVEILIADNQGESGEGIRVVQNLRKTDYKLLTHVVGVTERGISSVRNAILCFAFEDNKFDYLIMADDDQHLDANFVIELLLSRARYGADIVGSLVVADFPKPPARWMEDCALYSRSQSKQEGICRVIPNTGGVLITRQVFERHRKPKFDTRFNLTGGGDSEFFHRMRIAGDTVFAFTPQAIVYENISDNMMTESWAISRFYRIGIATTKIKILHGTGLKFWIALLVRLGIYIPGTFIQTQFGTKEINTLMHRKMFLSLQCGMVAGVLGKSVFPYK